MSKYPPACVLRELAALPMFAGCNRSELALAGRLGTRIAVADHTELLREGRPNVQFIVLLSGHAERTLDGRHVAPVGPGDPIGAVSLLGGGPASTTVITSGRADLLVLERRELVALLDASATVARNLLLQVSQPPVRRALAAISA